MANNSFSGKTAIVTGAGQGIGFQICKQLALAGATVLLNDVDVDMANDAAMEIRTSQGACIACPGDASDLDFIRDIVALAKTSFIVE